MIEVIGAAICAVSIAGFALYALDLLHRPQWRYDGEALPRLQNQGAIERQHDSLTGLASFARCAALRSIDFSAPARSPCPFADDRAFHSFPFSTFLRRSPFASAFFSA